jgi:hypothetical protein
MEKKLKRRQGVEGKTRVGEKTRRWRKNKEDQEKKPKSRR